VKDHSAEEQ